MKSEMKKKTPNIARETSSATVFAPANVGLRNSVMSNIGSRWCSSSRTKAVPETAATREEAEDQRRRPALAVRLDQRVDEREERDART